MVTPQCSPLHCSPAGGPSSFAQAGTLAAPVQWGPAPPCPPAMGASVGHTNHSGWTPCNSQNPQPRAVMGICFERMWGEPGASRTKRHLLNLVQPSPCHLSLTSDMCCAPPGDKPSQGHSSRDSAPHSHKLGRLWQHNAPKTHQEEGTGGGRGAGCF